MPRTRLPFPEKDYLEQILPRWFYAGWSCAKVWRRMMSERKNSSSLLSTPTRRQLIAGVGIAFGGLALGSTEAWAGTEEEISRTAETIHQEVVFKASRKRVYEALADTKQFDKVIHLSGVMQSMPPGGKPTEISREVGGAFALFGGYITGRHIEL